MTGFVGSGKAYTKDLVCMYDDKCQASASDEFGLPICTGHALKVHDRVEAVLAHRQMREQSVEAAFYSQKVREVGPTRNKEEKVYFVRLGNMVKIGFTRDLRNRLYNIPHEEVLRVIPGSMLIEKQYHVLCAQWRTVGEWFIDCPEFREAAGLDTPA